MLPKKERLTRAAFNRFFGLGRRSIRLLFRLSITPTTHSMYRWSLEKIAKTAVLRNKIRRRIYDIVRNYHKDHGLKGVYIFLVKSDGVTAKYETLKSEITIFLSKK